MLLAVALAVVALAVLYVITLAADDDIVVDITFGGVENVDAGERRRVEVNVEVIEPGHVAEHQPVRLLGTLTGPGTGEIQVASVEDGGAVELELVDGQFLFPSEDQPLVRRDLTDMQTFTLELTAAEGERPLELAVTLVSGEPVPPDIVRLSGPQRYETAARVSEELHPDGAETVYVARAFTFADVLAAGSAAAADGAPLLLAFEDSLPVVTRSEIARLGPERVVLIGGGAALSDAVAGELRALVDTTQRIAGRNRYETAARAALHAFDDPSTVVVVSGEDFEDALAAVAGAAAADAPVLLTQQHALPGPTRQALAELTPSRIVVLGGPDMIGTRVIRELHGLADEVHRVAGRDPYETALALDEASFEPAAVDVVVLASDLDFHDAFVGGPAAAALAAPMLLTEWDAVPEAVLDRLATLEPTVIYVLGTPSGAVSDQARAAATPDELTPARARPLGDTATSVLGSG